MPFQNVIRPVNWSRWVRLFVAIMVLGQAYADASWVLAAIGGVLLFQGFMNTGCHTNCKIEE